MNGSLTAFDAPVTISGRVNGDVVVFNGRVVLASGANVTGDVVSQNDPIVASGATIGGTTRRVQTDVNWKGFGWAGRTGVVAGRVRLNPADRARAAVAGRAGRAAGSRTRVAPGSDPRSVGAFSRSSACPSWPSSRWSRSSGFPLGLGLLAALALIYALGYTATAWIIGRRILGTRTGWVVAFLLGWGILRVLALIPAVGGLIWFVAVVFGLGALTVTIWRARSTAPAAPAPA